MLSGVRTDQPGSLTCFNGRLRVECTLVGHCQLLGNKEAGGFRITAL